MTYDEAIKNYGIDKPDMRLPAMVSLTDELTAELREQLKIEQRASGAGVCDSQGRRVERHAARGLVDEIRAAFGDCGLDFAGCGTAEDECGVCSAGGGD